MKRFGFAQLRFFIAAILFIAAGLKAWQLSTSPLPPVVQGSMFTPLLELFNDRYFQILIVVGEILFALVLISGLWMAWMWLLSLLGFTAFTLVSVIKGLSGETSCGCFGTVTVNPWITATFDAAIVGLLLVFRATKNAEPERPLFSLGNVMFSWLMIALPLVWLMASFQPAAITSSGEIIGESRVVMLYPKEWINQKWPLSSFVEIAEDLEQGYWIVVLYGADCRSCHEHFNEWKNKGFPVPSEGDERIALLEITGNSENALKRALVAEPYIWGSLIRERQWYVETPVVLLLQEGIVRQIWTDN